MIRAYWSSAKERVYIHVPPGGDRTDEVPDISAYQSGQTSSLCSEPLAATKLVRANTAIMVAFAVAVAAASAPGARVPAQTVAPQTELGQPALVRAGASELQKTSVPFATVAALRG